MMYQENIVDYFSKEVLVIDNIDGDAVSKNGFQLYVGVDFSMH
jgi:hypothetical protein